MTKITIAGGVYSEHCTWPTWNRIFGSGGRAAAALGGHVEEITLRAYARADVARTFELDAKVYGFSFLPESCEQLISFEYVHSMSNPVIRPTISRIAYNPPIHAEANVVLRFGMLEGSTIVTADRCVYDPQSAFNPEPFLKNGSKADHLAIVANRREVAAMSGETDPEKAARLLLQQGAEVVVVKGGTDGALVVTNEGLKQVPAFQSTRVWSIGSGDVFAATFAARWGVHRESPDIAAELASKAVAAYVETMDLPVPSINDLGTAKRSSALTVPGRVYLASPFFSIGQRWLVDEARKSLIELGLAVLSPVHDIGRGAADEVAPADLKALKECDRVFAVLDGLDSGTLFEVGYARANDIPVYALAQSVSPEELKMVQGSECRIYDDFVTALHHTTWRV